jgi:CRISPR-associated protein Csb2
MFAVVVDLLAGRYAAMAYNDRDRVEWPPHPARLFSALVATWGEDDPHSVQGQAERTALEWLEQQAPPEIIADRIEHAGIRTVMPVFVPVNDEHEVAEVPREKLDDAVQAAASLEGKAKAKAEKDLEKLRKKFNDDTKKSIAPPTKFGKEPRLGVRVLPDGRGRQPRTFPVAFPRTPRFTFVWRNAAPTPDTVRLLSGLLSRLVRLGHSSSQVHASVITEEMVGGDGDTRCTFRPDEEAGEHVIRWIDKGQVARLCAAFDLHRETEPRVLPARAVRYADDGAASPGSVQASSFVDDFIVFERTRGPRLPITSAAGLARQFRRALMACADQPIDPMISGHRQDGGPSDISHAAIVPLPFVGHRYADGGILGVAVILPRNADPAAKRAVGRALVRLEERGREDDDERRVRINLAEAPLMLRRVLWDPSQQTLRPRWWTRPARRWATATPIALDRNPGDLHASDPERRAAAFAEAQRSVADSFAHIGLPMPVELDVVRSCVLPGTAKPKNYPRFPAEASKTQRVLVHARIVFDEPVRGPLLVGAGRYQGLGLCFPLDGDANQ